MTASQMFYDHKREAHGGQYDGRCIECEAKWAALLAESKAKAGIKS